MVPSGRRVLIGLRVLFVLLLAAVLARSLVTTYRVAGNSMRETLQDGDRILVCHLTWLLQPVLAGDTVILVVEGEVLVKRVVAVPGDRIRMDSGLVVRNGRRVPESIPWRLNSDESFPEYHLAPDEYFVLGDNRRVSVDSRDFGPVTAVQLLGRVLLRISGTSVSAVAALEHRPG